VPTTATTSVASDNQRNSSLSALRLSEIALEPVAARHGVTTSSAESVDEHSAASDAAAESKLSRLSRESDLSTSASAEDRKMESVQTERELAADEVGSDPGTSESDVTTRRTRSRPIGTIYQSSLPDLVDSREDKDSATAVVSILLFSIFSVVIVVVVVDWHALRIVTVPHVFIGVDLHVVVEWKLCRCFILPRL